ncbi:MAG TPA: LapA family protein [Thermoanaerobaculia bacterium]|jgi:hypothetical protein
MYAQKKPIDNTHIVREKDRQRNRELLAVLFLGVPIGLFLLLFTWQNLEVIRLGSEATRLQKQLKETEAIHKQLESELDRLTSFSTVEEQAAALGFAAADPKTIVMVERAKAGGTSTSAVATTSGAAAAPAAVVLAQDPVAEAATAPHAPSSAPQAPAGGR